MRFECEQMTTIWEHINDLRSTLIRVLIVFLAGFLCCLTLYESIFFLATYPLQSSQTHIYTLHQERIVNVQPQSILYTLPQHAKIIYASEGIKKNAESIYEMPPDSSIDYSFQKNKNNLIIISPLEGFLVTVKLCFWLSLALTSPIWVYLLLQFILPGLRPEEKGLLFPFLIGSFFCLSTGLGLAYFITIPLANTYLQSFNTLLGTNQWTVSHYIDYSLILLLGHAIAFELGLLLLLVVHAGKIDPRALKQKRRYFIVSAFIIGAALTPPDVMTQFLLAIPLLVFYELIILYSHLRAKISA